MEILRFLFAKVRFLLCHPVYHNLMCRSRKTNYISLYIWIVLELISQQVTLSVHLCSYLMLTYVFVENMSNIDVISYILTIRGHSSAWVSISYSSLRSVVALPLFSCMN